jgi:N-acetylglucosaminyldiphosphoundecaprenol N-acetyl-beta-D-mannosaminyltransferase
MKNESNLAQKYATILGVRLNSTSYTKVLASVREKVGLGKKFYLVTPNPEMVLRAQKDQEFKKILNRATFSLPDGVGLAQAKRFLGMKRQKNPFLKVNLYLLQGLAVGLSTFINPQWLFKDFQIIKGRKLFLELVKLANQKGWKVFLLGGEKGEAEKTAEVLKRNYQKLVIEAFNNGPQLDTSGKPVTQRDIDIEIDIVERINKFKPTFLFLAFTPPKQEKWLMRNYQKLDFKGAFLLGGTFRYIAGYSKLPPNIFEQLGLEWVWRALTEPYRIRRIFNAFPIFPLRILKEKLNS